MAYQQLNVTGTWPVAAQYIAVGDTQIRLVNSHGNNLFWVTTPDDVVPTLPEVQASPISGGQVEDVTLLDGERLWIVAPWLESQVLDVTLMV
ncbi:MAG: hypothetical protein ACWA5A_02945 [Marinibacterium sp.]